jgi:hypothetical protein
MKKLLLITLMVIVPSISFADIYRCTVNKEITYQPISCQNHEDQTTIGITKYKKASSLGLSLPIPNKSIAIERDAQGHIKRSESAKNDFKALYPCPVNGHRSGPCPGYVIDHIKPLACRGADDPSNMQWQSVEDGKAKDKWERDGCEISHVNVKKKIPHSPEFKTSNARYYKPSYSTSTYLDEDSTVHIGPRGGRYVITSGGNKRYLPRRQH